MMTTEKISHAILAKWVQDMEKLCQPDKVQWLDGSEEERDRLQKEALKSGELIELNQEKLPGCYYHRSDPSDVARVEKLTFICTPTKQEAGPTNNWMAPQEAYDKASGYFRGSMKGRTMYVVPFSMGKVQSEFAKIGIQLTDSIYVALSMRKMTHMGKEALEKLGTDGEFTKCLHSTADLDIKKRLILHFPQDNTIWSVGSGYGGNALLGKKCMALRIGSYLGNKEGWLAEHMLILGVEDPKGNKSYIAAAFPSACGKTNLAMLVPPEQFRKKGYKVWTVGDDIAWLRIGEDGHLYAMNPEAGFFGVAPGTNSKTNPNAMAGVQKNTIFTNVLIKKDNTVWWEGGEDPVPEEGINWKGDPWKPGQKDADGKPIKGAHPNSRFTAPLDQCPSFSKEDYDNAQGVKISALIFGGRHAHLSPLVYQSFNWQHGVFVGATVSSETTAAQMYNQGIIRRDPFAMLPFCGYNMGRYFKHWLEMGKKMKQPPKIFHVNWFRKDEKENYLWPGFGENFRVLEWILERCHGDVSADETPIGYVARETDLNLEGLDLSHEAWQKLFSMSPENWKRDLESQKQFFEKLGDDVPFEIWHEFKQLKARLFDTNSKKIAV